MKVVKNISIDVYLANKLAKEENASYLVSYLLEEHYKAVEKRDNSSVDNIMEEIKKEEIAEKEAKKREKKEKKLKKLDEEANKKLKELFPDGLPKEE